MCDNKRNLTEGPVGQRFPCTHQNSMMLTLITLRWLLSNGIDDSRANHIEPLLTPDLSVEKPPLRHPQKHFAERLV